MLQYLLASRQPAKTALRKRWKLKLAYLIEWTNVENNSLPAAKDIWMLRLEMKTRHTRIKLRGVARAKGHIINNNVWLILRLIKVVRHPRSPATITTPLQRFPWLIWVFTRSSDNEYFEHLESESEHMESKCCHSFLARNFDSIKIRHSLAWMDNVGQCLFALAADDRRAIVCKNDNYWKKKQLRSGRGAEKKLINKYLFLFMNIFLAKNNCAVASAIWNDCPSTKITWPTIQSHRPKMANAAPTAAVF